MLLNVMGVPEPEYRPKIRAFLYQTPHAGDRNIPIPACPQPGIKAKVKQKVIGEKMPNKMKTQIFFIHGGMTFKNKEDYLKFLKTREISTDKKIKWHGEYLGKKLGKNFEIIKPRMPLQDYAKYDEWKISFERYFPYLRDNVILIGESLGAIFLAKYLSEK
jgi:hypothetical protein